MDKFEKIEVLSSQTISFVMVERLQNLKYKKKNYEVSPAPIFKNLLTVSGKHFSQII